MQEKLKKVTSETTGSAERTVTFFLQARLIVLRGEWTWDMQCSTVYCSEVMAFPQNFEGTKGIIHPDDLPAICNTIKLHQDGAPFHLDFRLITTYGEVKTLTGHGVSILDGTGSGFEPLPEQENLETTAIQQIINRKEFEFLYLRKDLTEATERLHSMGAWFIDKVTGETWYSDQVFRIHGLPPQSLNAHPNTFNSFIHPDDKTLVTEAFENAYQKEVSLHLQYRILLGSGEIHFVQQLTHWSFNRKGHRIFSGLLRDLTEELSTDSRLAAMENNLSLHQQILRFSEQQSGTGYWYINLITRKSFYSDNCLRIYGLKQPMLANNYLLTNLVHPEDKDHVTAVMDKMFREHILPETDFRIIRPDGKQRHLKQTGKLLVHKGADLIMAVVVQDITIQRAREHKIQDVNENLSLQRFISEHTEQTVDVSSFLWLPDGQMHWSEGFYRLLGYKPGTVEPLHRLFQKAVHPEDLKLFKDAIALVQENQPHDDLSIRIISKSGIRYSRLSFRQIDYNGKLVTLGIVQDITRYVNLIQKSEEDRNFTKAISDAIGDVLIVTNREYNIITWNAAAEEKTRIKKEDALNHNFFDVFPQLNEERFISQLQTVLLGEGREVHEARTGYINRPHSYYLVSFKNEQDEVLGVLHLVKDISNELELQHKLNERLNFIESLVETSVDRIVVLDSNMNYLYWNQKAEDYYAIKKERILGKNILEVFPGFRNDPSYQEFRKVLRGETVYIPATFSDESSEYFETYLSPIKNDKQEVTAVLWAVHDLSKELWQQERQHNAQHQMVQEQLKFKDTSS